MSKIKIIAVGNFENHNYYIFDKNNSFFDLLEKILVEILEEDWDWDEWKQEHKNINEFNDYHERDSENNKLEILPWSSY